MILTFGKYKGLNIEDIKDFRYIQWLVKCACSYELKNKKEAEYIRKNADNLLNLAIEKSKLKQDKVLFSIYDSSEF